MFAESQREGEGEGDERFAAALQGQAAVLGYYLTSDRQGRQSGVLPAPIAPLQAPDSAALHWNGYGANVSVLAAAAPQGFFNAQVDADGIVRSVIKWYCPQKSVPISKRLLRVIQYKPFMMTLPETFLWTGLQKP